MLHLFLPPSQEDAALKFTFYLKAAHLQVREAVHVLQQVQAKFKLPYWFKLSLTLVIYNP